MDGTAEDAGATRRALVGAYRVQSMGFELAGYDPSQRWSDRGASSDAELVQVVGAGVAAGGASGVCGQESVVMMAQPVGSDRCRTVRVRKISTGCRLRRPRRRGGGVVCEVGEVAVGPRRSEGEWKSHLDGAGVGSRDQRVRTRADQAGSRWPDADHTGGEPAAESAAIMSAWVGLHW